jgi:predicted PurR-regulated permease PerM
MNSISGRQVLFWGGAFAVFVLIISILGEVLLPFVLGMILAYFLDPLATLLEKQGLSRLGATVCIAVIFGLLGFVFFLVIGPLLVTQLSELASQIPIYFKQLREIIVTGSEAWFGKIFPGSELGAEEAMQNIAKDSAQYLTTLLKSVWSSGKAILNFLSLILITPVVTFFLLKDWNHFLKKIDGWLPRDHAPIIRLLVKRINRSIAGFIRGQVTISIFVGVFYSIALTFLGLKYGLLIGLSAGVLNIVPFLGSLVGFMISGTMAVVQYWPEWQPILYVLGVFLFGQLVDTNFLTPKIIGDKIRLHPVWLIFALIVSGYLFGVLGMLIAIPLAAAIGVLVRYALERYLDSELYIGSREEKPVVRPVEKPAVAKKRKRARKRRSKGR